MIIKRKRTVTTELDANDAVVRTTKVEETSWEEEVETSKEADDEDDTLEYVS